MATAEFLSGVAIAFPLALICAVFIGVTAVFVPIDGVLTIELYVGVAGFFAATEGNVAPFPF